MAVPSPVTRLVAAALVLLATLHLHTVHGECAPRPACRRHVAADGSRIVQRQPATLETGYSDSRTDSGPGPIRGIGAMEAWALDQRRPAVVASETPVKIP